jgi:hypothetical protein
MTMSAHVVELRGKFELSSDPARLDHSLCFCVYRDFAPDVYTRR